RSRLREARRALPQARRRDRAREGVAGDFAYDGRVSPRPTKVYDRAYFERWYRDPRYAVVGEGVRARRVQLAVAVTEYLLERPLRTVLDVGCGEGAWQPLLRAARPGVRYLGVDSSEYAIARYGRTRHLRLGSLATLHRMRLAGPFDLI